MVLWFFFSLFMLFFFFIFFFSVEGLIVEWDLMTFYSSFKFSFIWDFYSFFFLLVVLFISSNIFFYSKYYMDSEKKIIGFLWLLLSFVVSMCFLIVIPNLFGLLLGWDGLGLTSYLLVVYYLSNSSAMAGMLTFLVNRLGDVLFLFSIVFFSMVFDREIYEGGTFSFFLFFFILIAFSTKSAQVPFSSWLPAAMAAPTPVSSLVHSSTLVTAGVFLVIRFYSFFVLYLKFIFVLSLMTLLLAGIMAVFEWDMKKVIAFSTLSQLGFMMSSISIGLVIYSFFHLISHAMFKASLFMCCGLFIHSGDNSQEFRNSFTYLFSTPFISSCVMICLICLAGFPFTTGFFSKDFIIDGSLSSVFSFILFFMGVMLTIGYSLRFSFFMMVKSSSARFKSFLVYDNTYFLYFPILLLIVFCVFGGSVCFDMFFSLSVILIVSLGWKVFFLFSILFVSVIWYKISFTISLGMVKQYFFSSMWFLNKILSSRVFSLIMKGNVGFLNKADSGLIEYVGGQGVYFIMENKSSLFYRFSFIYLGFLSLFFFLLLMF